MLGAILVGTCLFLPGLLLCAPLRIRKCKFEISLLLSLGFFLLLLALSLLSNSKLPFLLGYLLVGIWGLASVLARTFSSQATPIECQEWLKEHIVELALIFICILYFWYAGAYQEVPADIWSHLGSIQYYLQRLRQGWIDFDQPWYLFLALGLYYSDSPITSFLNSYSLVGSVCFAVGLARFAKHVFAPLSLQSGTLKASVITGVLLTLATHGTSVFAYFRYYTFGAAFLNYILFLFSVTLVYQCTTPTISETNNSLYRVCLVLLTFLVTYLFHKQEAMFIVAMLFTTGVLFLLENRKKGRSTPSRCGYSTGISLVDFSVASATLAVLVVSIFLFFIDPREVVPLLNNTVDILAFINSGFSMHIADPLGRPLETIGLWGFGLLVLYFVLVPTSHRSPLLTVLAVAPFLMTFTPFLSDFILRLVPDETIWRFFYMTPFGLLLVFGLCALSAGDTRSGSRRLRTFGLVLVLSLPFVMVADKATRWSTLVNLEVGNTSKNWADLFSKLNQIGPRNVLTDPITCYLVNALTHSRCFGFKFHGSGGFIPINYPYYSSRHFIDFKDWLLVVNKRNGTKSFNGLASGHWHELINLTSRYYSPELTEFLHSTPPHLQQVWSEKNITVFEIR